MLKNKKCQALLIAASAFIGINGNVYGSNPSIVAMHQMIAARNIYSDNMSACRVVMKKIQSLQEKLEGMLQHTKQCAVINVDDHISFISNILQSTEHIVNTGRNICKQISYRDSAGFYIQNSALIERYDNMIDLLNRECEKSATYLS